jgi:hypothetical protein
MLNRGAQCLSPRRGAYDRVENRRDCQYRAPCLDGHDQLSGRMNNPNMMLAVCYQNLTTLTLEIVTNGAYNLAIEANFAQQRNFQNHETETLHFSKPSNE